MRFIGVALPFAGSVMSPPGGSALRLSAGDAAWMSYVHTTPLVAMGSCADYDACTIATTTTFQPPDTSRWQGFVAALDAALSVSDGST
jgi:hypothetical protein